MFHCSTIAAPSSAPITPTVTLVSSRFFSIEWDSPPFEETNGVIRNYVITLTELETETVFTETTNSTQTTISGLHPFYTYQCAVAAETIAIGPYSTQITVKLGEEGML